jgi:SAM-dependent methyltransferase
MTMSDIGIAAGRQERGDRPLPARANLGCGPDYREGWHNVDVRPGVGADEVVDLDDYPWPWPDDVFERVLMDNVIEHLDDRVAALHELARVVEPGGSVVVRVPHWNSPGAWTCPDHTGTITHRTFDNYSVSEHYVVREVNATRVRFGRMLPEPAALWLADHIGHLVSEVEIVAEVVDDD